jgi:hypothetical protein
MDKLNNRSATTHDAVAPTTIEVLASGELTFEEEQERLRLERVVERSFYEAGKALRELRDRRLYRNSHKTFEEYCKDRFRYNRSRSYQFIDAATVMDNLQKCPQFVIYTTTSTTIAG